MTDEEEFRRDIIAAPRSVYKALTYRDEQIAALLEEVERLRVALEREQTDHANCEQFHHEGSMAKNAAMVLVMEQNTALREMARIVAEESWFTHSSTLGGTLQQSACCPFEECEREAAYWRDIPHTPECPVTRARALLAPKVQEH